MSDMGCACSFDGFVVNYNLSELAEISAIRHCILSLLDVANLSCNISSVIICFKIMLQGCPEKESILTLPPISTHFIFCVYR